MNLFNQPHGGRLVNRVLSGVERNNELDWAQHCLRIFPDDIMLNDFELIANGAYSPLTGFMTQADYDSVLKRMRLQNGRVWTVPVTLLVNAEIASHIKLNSKIALSETSGRILGTMQVIDKFKIDLELESQLLFASKRARQLARERLARQGEVALGGEIFLLNQPGAAIASDFRKSPRQVRENFEQAGWQRVVSFQAPNPISHSADSVEKCALEIVNGLFLQPNLVEKDLSAELVKRKICQLQKLIEFYYPENSIELGYLPWVSRLAGPREAVHEAIVRKNFGCSHYIVAEKHCLFDNFYTFVDYRRIFNELPADELGITPIFSEETFYCRKCEAMVTLQTCPHNRQRNEIFQPWNEDEMLCKGKIPPLEFIEQNVMPLLIDQLWDASFSESESKAEGSYSQLNPKLQRLVNEF
jgi:sulfate adenylyltransferase